jgi:Xaa-Pro aminopeptidase
MTRTVVIGKADGEMKKVYGTVLSAQRAALEAICEGISCREADRTARDVIAAAGYGDCFGHSLGHGVGLYIHEAPSLSPRAKDDSVLRRGNVVTVEPGIYIPGKYGVRIENMVLVTENGCENLTHSNRELIKI